MFGDRSRTQDKLERVRKYLVAYATIMSKRPLPYAYIDGFAGTGYHELRQGPDEGGAKLFPEAEEPEVVDFLDGSARIALNVAPRFSKYIFIEKDPEKARELEKLKAAFPDKGADIVIQAAEANAYLQDICGKSWDKRRAVLFIDPFGMQLTWDTVKAVAKTEAIDTWILFPVSAVNRLLKKDGNIPDGWRRRLDTMFGESDWFDVFFPREKSALFGDEMVIRRKAAGMDRIGGYFNKRLCAVFADVAPNPYTLRNTNGIPLFLLCFAAGNPRAAKTAIKIAQDILKRDPVAAPMLPLSE
jgi:three-Cys-motif partner protein